MKKLLLLAITLAAASYSFAQCTPTTDFGDQPYGVSPDTLVNFVDGSVNNLYSQQIDVKVPLDGAFLNAAFITVDSATVVSISGLPAGLSLECAGDAFLPCTYLAGSVGCAVISGIPETAGTFQLTVDLMVYSSIGPVPFSFPGYRIVIDGPTAVDNYGNLAFKVEDIRPNPANLSATLYINSKDNGIADFHVFDLVGKEVYTRKIRLTQGRNKLDYNTTQLPEGIYIYRLDAFGESVTSRLVIVH